MKKRPKHCTCFKAPPPRHFIPHTPVSKFRFNFSWPWRPWPWASSFVLFIKQLNKTDDQILSLWYPKKRYGKAILYLLNVFLLLPHPLFFHCFFFYNLFDKSGLEKVLYAKHIDSETLKSSKPDTGHSSSVQVCLSAVTVSASRSYFFAYRTFLTQGCEWVDNKFNDVAIAIVFLYRYMSLKIPRRFSVKNVGYFLYKSYGRECVNTVNKYI